MSHRFVETDVAVVGFGPVGQLAALLLGSAGVRVVALERADAPFGAPRAAVTDDACQRIFLRAGVSVPVVVPRSVAMVTAGGRSVPILDPARGEVPALVSFDQVEVERVLAAAAARVADVRFGCEVVSLVPGEDAVDLRCADGSVVRASWVLGCDGARSSVRRAAGIGFGGSTFAQPWLVVDAEVDEEVPGVDGVRFVADPRRPAVTLPLAPGLHRWEHMLAAGEPVPDWRPLVARWTDPDALRVRRVAVYTYHARVADRWRAGRVVLAGDAAHVMPPFAGQGLSAGLRDIDTLAWKLAAVVRGADPALLDTYEAERRPEVERYSALARLMGAVLQTRRSRLAGARDAVFTGAAATPVLGPWLARGGARPVPSLGGALATSPLAPLAGSALVPRRRSRVDPCFVPGGGAGRLAPAAWDALLPPGWCTIGPEPLDAWAALDLPHRTSARRPQGGDPRTFAVVRPDRYLFAAGRKAAVERAAQHFDLRWTTAR